MSIDTDFSTILDEYVRQLRRSALPWNRWEAVRDSGAFALTVPEDSAHTLLQHGRGYIAYAGLSRTFRQYYAQILLPIDKANRAGQRLRAGEYPLLLDDFQLYFLQTTGPDAKAAANAVKARLEARYSPLLHDLGFTSSRDPDRSRREKVPFHSLFPGAGGAMAGLPPRNLTACRQDVLANIAAGRPWALRVGDGYVSRDAPDQSRRIDRPSHADATGSAVVAGHWV
jgi:hypothetical protein